MAWTRKSSCPHLARSASNTRIDAGEILDIARQYDIDAERLRQRPDALAERIALIGEGKLGALRRAASLAMPQAIE